MNPSNKRIFYLDVIRATACLGVILLHTSAGFVSNDIGSSNFWVGNIINGSVRFTVPVFIMISGAVLLDDKYDFYWNKHISHVKKLIMFLLFWNTVYCIIFNIAIPNREGIPLDIESIASTLILGFFHLWYIYMIIGLYLIVPLLRCWISKRNITYVKYFLVLAFIFSFLLNQIAEIGCYYSDTFTYIRTLLNNKVQIRYVGGYTAYMILGWYLNNYDLKNNGIAYLVGFLASLFGIVGTYIISTTLEKPLQLYSNMFVNVLLQSIAVFVFIKKSFPNSKHIDSSMRRCVSFVSKYSLGIYAIHAGILLQTARYIHVDSAILHIPLVFIIVTILSIISSYLLSKIPILKRFVI